MDKRIFKKCKTLGKYYGLTVPKLNTPESMKFYDRNKAVIDFECEMYSEINESRKKLGGDKKIHMNGKDN